MHARKKCLNARTRDYPLFACVRARIFTKFETLPHEIGADYQINFLIDPCMHARKKCLKVHPVYAWFARVRAQMFTKPNRWSVTIS